MEITLKNIGYRYKNKKLLDHINLKISDNHITGITGEYKSLLCEMIDAVKMPTSGSIIIDTTPLEKENVKWIRKEVSIIHQDYHKQIFTNNVSEEFSFVISMLDYKPYNKDKKMEQALLLVGIFLHYRLQKLNLSKLQLVLYTTLILLYLTSLL